MRFELKINLTTLNQISEKVSLAVNSLITE